MPRAMTPTLNGLIALEGPRVLTVTEPIPANGFLDLDLVMEAKGGIITCVQSLMVINVAAAFTILIRGSEQLISVPAARGLITPVYTAQPLRARITGPGGQSLILIFCNFPQAACLL